MQSLLLMFSAFRRSGIAAFTSQRHSKSLMSRGFGSRSTMVADLSKYEAELLDLNSTIITERSVLNSLQTENMSLKTQLLDSVAQIQRLSRLNSALQKSNTFLEMQSSQLHRCISELTATNNQMFTRINEAERLTKDVISSLSSKMS